MKIKICKFGIEVLLLAISWGEGSCGWIKYGSNNIGVFAARIEADEMSGWDLFSN